MDDVGLFEPGDLSYLIVSDRPHLLVLLVEHLSLDQGIVVKELKLVSQPLPRLHASMASGHGAAEHNQPDNKTDISQGLLS